MANAFAFCRMADTFHLMKRMRYVIGKGGLREDPLAIRLGKGGGRKEQDA